MTKERVNFWTKVGVICACISIIFAAGNAILNASMGYADFKVWKSNNDTTQKKFFIAVSGVKKDVDVIKANVEVLKVNQDTSKIQIKNLQFQMSLISKLLNSRQRVYVPAGWGTEHRKTPGGAVTVKPAQFAQNK